ncbi:MAG: putative glycosyltransferase EpsH [Planctomycetota bacterium]|jgi:glycosyltransferase involved in cell wall biosynthesis
MTDGGGDPRGIEAPPRAAVVVAFHGRAEKTLAALESLLAQRFGPDGDEAFEVVLVDDGSPDDTAARVAARLERRNAAKDGAKDGGRDAARAQLVRLPRNLGANAARNRGVAATTAPLVAFLDSDCRAEPHWLETLVRVFDDPTVGAASGRVEDTASENAWELAFRGTHRLPRRGPVSRLVIGNLCVRRALLAGGLDESRPTRLDPATGRPDPAISARSDEEDLNLAIRAAGWKVVAEPDALAWHDHPYTRRSLLRQAWFGGQSAAELVWRHRLGPRKDLGPIALAWLALAAALAAMPWTGPVALAAPALLALLPIAAISYNELRNKGKRPLELVRAAPALLLYYHWRLAGYLVRRAQLVGRRRPARAGAGRHALPAPPAARGATA